MAGRIRDPLVGRDVLFGVILGISWAVIFAVAGLALKHISAEPDLSSPVFLLGFRRVLGACFTHAAQSVQGTLEFFFLMFVFRVLFRKPWIAAVVFVLFWVGLKSYGNHHWMYVAPAVIAVYAIAAFVILRFGFIALAVGNLHGGPPGERSHHYRLVELLYRCARLHFPSDYRVGVVGMLYGAGGAEAGEG